MLPTGRLALSWLIEGLPGFPPKPVHSHHPFNINPSFSESLVPELDLAVPSPLPQNPPQTPSASASPAITLPPLEAPNDRFLSYAPTLAGRAVIIELQSAPTDSRDARQSLWKAYQRAGNNLQELGLAAQTLERSRINWRQARNTKEVLEAFRALPQGTTN